MRDYGYRQNLGFLRFCDDPELACCQAEKDYLRLKAQENDLYSKAMSFEYDIAILQDENAKLRAVVDAAKEWINCPCEDMRECLECTAFKFRNALAELEGEGKI